jgi:hypothetical protein
MRSASDGARQRLRARAVAALGGCCRTCGFSDPRALHIDHVNGGGAEERRNGVSAAALYRRIIAGVSGYQLLCANCNMIKKHEQSEHVGRRVYERSIPTASRPNERWTPEQRAKQSERARRMYQERPEFRKRQGDQLRAYWQDPAFREQRRREASERMKRRWASGEVPNRPNTRKESE